MIFLERKRVVFKNTRAALADSWMCDQQVESELLEASHLPIKIGEQYNGTELVPNLTLTLYYYQTAACRCDTRYLFSNPGC